MFVSSSKNARRSFVGIADGWGLCWGLEDGVTPAAILGGSSTEEEEEEEEDWETTGGGDFDFDTEDATIIVDQSCEIAKRRA